MHSKAKSITENQKKDVAYNWHPYTQHKTESFPIVIKKGKDAILWDEHDNEFIDAIGSWWCNPHGHCNPIIANAISLQINQLEHVLFGGFTHPKVIELSEKLLQLLPKNQDKLFYSDNGSTSVEVAIKMALQYFHNRNEKKDCIIAFDGAYHGDTFAAMASSGINIFTQSFQDFFMNVERIPVPTKENKEIVFQRLQEIIENQNPAAFIFECLVQGSAGMNIYSSQDLDVLIETCQQNNVFCVADEVMTGFGRTGKLFASEHLQNPPDMICLSKALTGGFIPMAITSCTAKIYDAFLDEDINKALFHGHTFMANPAGCAAALASLELTLSNETQQSIDRIHTAHQDFANKLEKRDDIKNLAVFGVILRLEICTENQSKEFYGTFRNKLYHYYIKHKIILRPVGNIVYVLPPYCITDRQLQRVYDVIWDSIDWVLDKNN